MRVCVAALLPAFTLLVVGFVTRKIPEPSVADPGHEPGAFVGCLLEEFLVLLECAVPALWTVQIGQDPSYGVGGGKDKQQEVLEVVEPDGRQKGDGEIRQAPDDDRDGGPLGSRCRREDFGRDQSWWDEPADPKDCSRRVQDDDAGYACGEQRDG